MEGGRASGGANISSCCGKTGGRESFKGGRDTGRDSGGAEKFAMFVAAAGNEVGKGIEALAAPGGSDNGAPGDDVAEAEVADDDAGALLCGGGRTVC